MASGVTWPWASATQSASKSEATAVFKPVAAKPSAKPVMESLARLNASSGPEDSVKVSKLAKALNGMAAKAYEHLDKDSRTQLNSLVESGRVSAEDAVKGLRFMAKNALFSRFMRDAASTPEEEEAGRQMRAMSDAFTAAAQRTNTPAMAARLAMGKLNEEHQSGTLSEEDYKKQYAEAFKDFAEKSRQEMAQYPNMDKYGDLLNSVFSSKAKRFADIDFGDDDHENSSKEYKIASKGELDAAERLYKAGFMIQSNAMQRFAEDYDIPGLGKGVMPAWKELKPISVS
jgi:hypothetical protein